MDADRSPRREYLLWVEDQIEAYKAGMTREELLELADEAVRRLFDAEDGQYPLTEILLRDAVDALIFQELGLPGYRSWLRRRRAEPEPDPVASTDHHRRAS